MSFLNVSHISKQLSGLTTVHDVSFTIPRFRKLAIAGETGSGKSTLLKIIGGLVQPDNGTIMFENERVEGPLERLLPGHPKIAYLSQHFELRNNYSIEEELDYLNQLSSEEAEELYKICHIDNLLQRKTTEVSGGEKQRISLARLLLSSPRLLLLDEPYSNLDIIHKNILKEVVRNISERLQITCMLVSHDAQDVLAWADEILVMKEGNIVQKGTPYDVYNHPVNEYVAGLFGAYNVLPAALYRLFANKYIVEKHQYLVRPERFFIKPQSLETIACTITDIRFYGNYYEADVLTPDGDKILISTTETGLEKGRVLHLSLRPEDV